jgi:hypothetical protein
MHAEVLALAESLSATGTDAATAREIALRRGLALLALGRTSDAADAIRSACQADESGPRAAARSVVVPNVARDDRTR